MNLSERKIDRFRATVLKWYSSNRRSFSWREEPTPFRVLLSEMLLRKTRASSTEPILEGLLEEYPDPESLAAADPKSIQSIIRPLGLHRIRSKALVNTGTKLVQEHGGNVPRDLDSLLDLPHVGRYGANATLTFAFREPRPIVDANVVRLFSRVFGTPVPTEVHKADELWQLAAELVSPEKPRAFNWAILDLASKVCTPQKPSCADCPLREICEAYQSGKFS
jgi:A/G-specific adenine glycosylase